MAGFLKPHLGVRRGVPVGPVDQWMAMGEVRGVDRAVQPPCLPQQRGSPTCQPGPRSEMRPAPGAAEPLPQCVAGHYCLVRTPALPVLQAKYSILAHTPQTTTCTVSYYTHHTPRPVLPAPKRVVSGVPGSEVEGSAISEACSLYKGLLASIADRGVG